MATLKIEPITTQTADRRLVHITGIKPTDHDCIVGTLVVEVKGATWDLAGNEASGQKSANLDMQGQELQLLAKLALHLGAKA